MSSSSILGPLKQTGKLDYIHIITSGMNGNICDEFSGSPKQISKVTEIIKKYDGYKVHAGTCKAAGWSGKKWMTHNFYGTKEIYYDDAPIHHHVNHGGKCA